MSWATRLEDCRDAADWAYCTCVEYSCGYSQPNRTGISEELLRFGEAETDCSAGVSWWLWKGGLLGECPWFSTHNERERLAGEGFEPLDPGQVAPERNDVLWRRGHTALYIGEGLQAEAVRTERGDAGYDGSEPGDQDGGETVVRPYDPGAWEQILRPPAGRGPQVTGTWLREGGRWWHQHADGSWPTGWASIEGSWYLFDGRGWMLTGWQEAGCGTCSTPSTTAPTGRCSPAGSRSAGAGTGWARTARWPPAGARSGGSGTSSTREAPWSSAGSRGTGTPGTPWDQVARCSRAGRSRSGRTGGWRSGADRTGRL